MEGKSERSVRGRAPVELVVQAGFHQMHLLVHGDICRHRSVADGAKREHIVLMTEVDVVVLELRRPVRGEGVFDAGAEQRAEARVGDLGRERGADATTAKRADVEVRTVLDLRPGHAALHVEQGAVVGHAEAARHIRDPAVLGMAGQHDDAGRGALEIGPAEITFDADQTPAGELPVAADRHAAQEPVGRGLRDRERESRDATTAGTRGAEAGELGLRRAPRTAHMAADVEPGPRPDWCRRRRRLVDRCRQISGHGRVAKQRDQRGRGEKMLPHDLSPISRPPAPGRAPMGVDSMREARESLLRPCHSDFSGRPIVNPWSTNKRMPRRFHRAGKIRARKAVDSGRFVCSLARPSRQNGTSAA